MTSMLTVLVADVFPATSVVVIVSWASVLPVVVFVDDKNAITGVMFGRVNAIDTDQDLTG